MKYDLAQLAKGKRRKIVTFRPIKTTKAQADALARITLRMIAPWQSDRIVSAYDRELQRVMTTDSIDDLGRLFEELGEEVGRLILELTPDLRDWAFRVEGWHRRKWRDTVLAGADVDLTYLIGPQDARETIDAFLQRNVALVRDISNQARGRISDAVFRGIQARTPTREVAKEIAEATGMARKRATRVAADQSTKLSANLDMQRQREAGLDYFKYNHSGKLHPRSWHKARNGKIYERDTMREVSFEGGKKSYGADRIERGDGPSEPPWCACNAQGVLVLDGEVF